MNLYANEMAGFDEIRNILVIDEQPFIRIAVSEILRLHFIDQQIDICIHDAEDVQTAVRLTDQLSVGGGCLALVDFCMPQVCDMDLIKHLRLVNAEMFILVFSMLDEKIFAEPALLAGANGYLMKDVKPPTFVQAIQCVCSGNIWLSDSMKNTLFSRAAGLDPVKNNPISLLSNRELEIFDYIGQGLSRLKINKITGLSNNTIETYRKNIKLKLGLQDFSELNKAAFLNHEKSNKPIKFY